MHDPVMNNDFVSMTPEKRLAMVWPLTVQAYAFLGIDIPQ